MPATPTSLALTNIADGSTITAAPHRNNYSSIQTAVNALITILNEVNAKGDLVVGSAADTLIRLAAGTNGQFLTADSAETSGLKWVALTSVEANLAADVSLAVAGTFYDGPSASLVAGTWLICATVTCSSTAGDDEITAKLWDGTTVESSAQGTIHGANYSVAISLFGIVSPAATTTYKVSCTKAGGSTSVISAAAPNNGAGNNASHIRAIKIG